MKELKKKFFSSLSFAYNKGKRIDKIIYQKLNLLKNYVSIYEKVVRPLHKILVTILQWAVPVIAVYIHKFSELISDLTEWWCYCL